MKTKQSQVDGLETTLAQLDYQTPTIVGTQIRVRNESKLSIVRFTLSTDVSGGAFTISLDDGATEVALKNGDGSDVTELSAGLVEVAYVAPFFILRSGGVSEKNFLMKYDGISDIIEDLKGNPVHVSIGDYVYNEFNYTKLLGEENIINIDRTTPVQVVNVAYDTSGNGGRKLVRLSNGWLVAMTVDSSNSAVRFYVSKDNGATFTYLAYANLSTPPPFVALTSFGNMVYAIGTFSTYTNLLFWKFDATTVINSSPVTAVSIDASQTAFNGCSLAIDSNGHLHATWSSKNATYPNSFNIRYSKSIDGGVTWASPTQVTTNNNTGQQRTHLCIVIGSDNYPKIFSVYDVNPQWYIFCTIFNGSSWTQKTVYMTSVYTELQTNPSATVDSSGVIHVAWNGLDAVSNSQNLRYSKSNDNGATWSSMEKLTNLASGIAGISLPSIATNSVGKVFIGYQQGSIWSVYLIEGTSGSWGAVQTIATGVSGNGKRRPQLLDNYKMFEKPLMIFQEDDASKISFRGKWTEDLTTAQIIPPISLATNKSQLQAIYANTLKMHNPKTDARYQGFVSKKDLWTNALQELDWVSASISKSKNLFGVQGTSPDKRWSSGMVDTSNPNGNINLNITNLGFTPSKVFFMLNIPTLNWMMAGGFSSSNDLVQAQTYDLTNKSNVINSNGSGSNNFQIANMGIQSGGFFMTNVGGGASYGHRLTWFAYE